MQALYHDSVFLAGNLEAQRLATNMNPEDKYLFVRRHFIYSCLLSENVYFPAANYFQSDITQRIADEFQVLFRDTNLYPQSSHIAINPSKENFRGEALEKCDSYVDASDYQCYTDPIQREAIVRKLDHFTEPFGRPGKLVQSLNHYVNQETKEGGKLNQAVNALTGSPEQTARVLRPLVQAVETAEKAIVPEYIIQFDQDHVLNGMSERLVRLSLLKAYADSLEKHYHAYVCNPLVQAYHPKHFFPYEVYYLDTQIFHMFISLFDDVPEVITHLSADQLLLFKHSERFRFFLRGYQRFIAELSVKTIHGLAGIQAQIDAEKIRQTDALYTIITDAETAAILYQAMYGIKGRVQRLLKRKVLSSDILYRNGEEAESTFLYTLVNEVYETFMNRYTPYLMAMVKKQVKFSRRIIMINMFNKNNNVGGTQTIVEKSQDVSFQQVQTETTFYIEDAQQIGKLIEEIFDYKGSELSHTEKSNIVGALSKIEEKILASAPCGEEVKKFQMVRNGLVDTAQKILISLAANILSKALMTKLGM